MQGKVEVMQGNHIGNSRIYAQGVGAKKPLLVVWLVSRSDAGDQLGSWFVQLATKNGGQVLLGSALTKYVMKNGRLTVEPKRCFTIAGWVPPKPGDGNSHLLSMSVGGWV